MGSANISRSTYLSKNVGDFPESVEILGRTYEKVDDLRYGTNPHQAAAYYRPAEHPAVIGGMKILKTGKSGLSQTNLEDISYALGIVKFFEEPACACMKHVNPSGAAAGLDGETLRETYMRARDCDPRAAFGSVVAFNVPVDAETATEIMSSFVECVVAPGYEDRALEIFNDGDAFKRNRHIRILQCGDPRALPRFVGDDAEAGRSIKVLADGSLVIADPLLTHVRSADDFDVAEGSNKRMGEQTSTVTATEQEKKDLLAAWYINLNVRSNGVVIVKNGGALAIGTGEQDRVGAVEQAVWKFEHKYEGEESIEGAVMASDGFFPFPDGVEVAARAGVTAVVAPAGSLRDADVIARANELGVALFHAPERIFSHH